MSVIRSFVAVNRRLANALVERFPSVFASPSYKQELMRRICVDLESNRPATVLEVGGIDRPLLSKGGGFAYVGLDIELREACELIYDRFIVQSIEEPLDRCYEMIISKTLLEHVPNNARSVKSIYDGLVPGGRTHHYVPARWHPYSMCLRLVGPRLQKKLIRALRPGTEHVTGYPAYFSECSVGAMRALFERTGFESISIRPYFRANDYFAFFLPAFLVITLLENLCAILNLEMFASGFVISATKPRR